MRLVVDSNVIISSFFWGGKSRQVMQRIIDGWDELFTADVIMDEIHSVMLRPKFNARIEYVQQFMRLLAEISFKVKLNGLVRGACRDAKDDMILECALLSQADFIVSGDNDLLTLKQFQGIAVVNPSEYLNIV